jgi:general secretion pathway protein G
MHVRHHAGFTLIELVIAVAIVGVLAMMAVPMLEASAQRQKEAELRSALRQIRTAIDAYRQAVLDKKIEVAADASGYPQELTDLTAGVTDISSPEGKQIYFMRRLPKDPLAPLEQSAEESWGKRSYASAPDDPKEGDDIFDVYSRSEKVGMNGIPYREW